VESLSSDVAAGIVRVVGRYLRAAPVRDVPSRLRRFRSFRPETLLRHRDEVLDVLEDEDVRTSIRRWLDDVQPKLPKPDGHNLRLAVERPDGWRDQLVSQVVSRPSRAATSTRSSTEREAIEVERSRARAARDELKRARQRARAEIGAAEARVADLEKEITGLTASVAAARDRAVRAEADAESARAELERELRKARREVTNARSERDELKTEARSARRALSTTTRDLERMRRRVEELERWGEGRAPRPKPEPKPKPKKRRPLAVPKGRLSEDPQTLDEWLAKPDVHMLVDGYNAARSPGAFGDLDLEGQRERLIEEVFKLAVRREAAAIIVFDGADVAPGTRRRRRGPVTIEYSRASETADDHMVALLMRLPPDPVVVVTNDRELQERAAAEGATIATSNQLMGLIR
jgi:predicted RNA-binding protein with PIN domain